MNKLNIVFVSVCAQITLAILFIYFDIGTNIASCAGIIFCLTSVLYLKLLNWPFFLVLRVALLAIPGFVTGSLIFIFGQDHIVMIHAASHIYQTKEISAKVLLLTSTALHSSILAWLIASKKTITFRIKFPGEDTFIRFLLYSFIAVTAGKFTADALGDFVWHAAYATQTKSIFLGIGAMPLIATIGIIGQATTILNSNKRANYQNIIFLLTFIYALLICMLFRGMRLEVFSSVIAIYSGYILIKGKNFGFHKIFFGGVALYICAQILGTLRSIVATQYSFQNAISMALKFYEDEGFTTGFFHLGTFADIAATFYNTVGMYDDGILIPLRGSSYMDYIARTLPEFINPDRPESLAWLFTKMGLSSGGGFFELAEAYLNFGAIGCIIVPFAVTYLISQFYLNAIRHRNSTSLMIYMMLISFYLRGIWYQNFVFYKGLVSLAFIELIIAVIILVLHPFIKFRKIYA